MFDLRVLKKWKYKLFKIMCTYIIVNLFLFPLLFPFLPNIEIETNNQSNLTIFLIQWQELVSLNSFQFKK